MTDHYAEAERLLAHEYRNDEAARTGYMAAQLHAMLGAAEGQRALLALMEQAMAAAPPKPADTEPPAALSIPWPPDEAVVEKVARTIADVADAPLETEEDKGQAMILARAVLDALAGDR